MDGSHPVVVIQAVPWHCTEYQAVAPVRSCLGQKGRFLNDGVVACTDALDEYHHSFNSQVPKLQVSAMPCQSWGGRGEILTGVISTSLHRSQLLELSRVYGVYDTELSLINYCRARL